jgi:murein tripeptide amidase MpaA
MAYLNVVEVESALVALAAAYPGTCELITLPEQSHEGRTSHAIRIGQGALDSRPGILIAGGQHAREWGTCEICITFATDLLAAYAANSGLTYGGQSFPASLVQRLVQDAQIFVYPLINPDGRNYSQTAEAMWRKNRNPAGGVDLNRNFDVLWDFNTFLSPAAGAVVSDNPASDVYHGTAPFSEPESRNVRFMFDTFAQIRWSVDIHSYSQLLYHNWGHDQNQVTTPSQNFLNPAFDGQRGVEDDSYGEFIPSDDLGTQCSLVMRMQSALFNVRGITYQTGQSFALYPTTGTLTDYPYSRHISNPALTKTHGFLIEWGTEFQPPWAEMENIIADVSSALVAFADEALNDCGILDVALETPTLQFIDVPESETTFRAVTFRVTACCDVTFDITAGPTVISGPAGTAFGTTPLGTSSTAPAEPDAFSFARLWVSYQGTDAGDVAAGTITVKCRQTNQVWTVPISANVIERPVAAVMMVLDQSNSMSSNSGIGPGITRSDVLRFSAPSVVDVIEDGNALGILRFDQDPYPTMPITDIDFASRITANGHIASYTHNPDGWTSIGEAVFASRTALNAPGLTQPVKAMIVLTDGQEQHNGFTRRFIADVADQIDARVYAIGLGTPSALNPAALQALCNGTDGYMMVTGALDTEALFRLTKYYQQILAGVTNNEIVVDPEGSIAPGQKHVIPFRLSETDISSDAILLTPAPQAIRYSIETPSGEIIDPSVAGVNAGITLGGGAQTRFYRMSLPAVIGGAPNHAGQWKAILEVDDKYFKRYLSTLEKTPDLYQQVKAHGIRYSVLCRTWSNLRMAANANQSGHEPGAVITLRASLTEFGVPVDQRAHVTAEVTHPGGIQSLLAFTEVSPGTHEATFRLGQAGVTQFRIMASGRTFKGTPFTREQTLTGAVWQGGDRPPPSSGQGETGTGSSTFDLCCWIDCMISTDSGQRLLKSLEITPDDVKKCLEKCCDDHGRGDPKRPKRTPV